MMMRLIHKQIIPIIILVVTVCASNIQWGDNHWKNIIKTDGKAYYAYLPAAFIYQDLHFSFFDELEKKYPNPQIFYDYRIKHDNRTINKYYVGTALAQMPFFITAHILSHVLGYPPDGYSKLYCIAISIAAIFYLFVALLFLKKLLERYHASNVLISFILIAITFATNVFYYVVCEPAMSHLYSFAFITMLMYYLRHYFSTPKPGYIIIVAVLLGIITLIRPVNILIILISPFIAGNKTSFLAGMRYFKNNLKPGISGLLLFLLIISIQPLIYKIQTGHFWIYSYGNEKFNWSDPQLIDFLFSYKKGLFVYTPLTFISIIGLYGIYRTNKFQFFSLAVFLFLLVYVLSSWWNWWYGGSFSSRSFIEYLGIIALLLYFSYDLLRLKWRRFYSFLIIGCIFLCQVQTYQYRYYLIHWEKMDKEHYWNVFLRLNTTNNPNADLLQ